MSTTVYCSLHFLQSIGHYVAYAILPMASVACVALTTQIITSLAVFSLFWSEPVDLVKISASAICVSGITLVLQPDFIFGKMNTNILGLNPNLECGNCTHTVITEIPNITLDVGDMREGDGREGWTLDSLGYILPVISGTALTLDVLVLKKRPYLTENMIQVLFWSFAMNTLVSAILMLAMEKLVVPESWYDFTLVLIHGLTYSALWPIYFYTAEHIEGNTYTLISATSVVLMLIFQYTFLSDIQPGHRNWMEVVGALLVMLGFILGSFLGLLKYYKKSNAKSRQIQ